MGKREEKIAIKGQRVKASLGNTIDQEILEVRSRLRNRGKTLKFKRDEENNWFVPGLEGVFDKVGVTKDDNNNWSIK